MWRALFGTRLSPASGASVLGGRVKQRSSRARRFPWLEYLEGRALMATINASAMISSAASGSNFNYTMTLTNAASSTSAIGTFWYAWNLPNVNYLATSPLSVTAPSGWSDQITNAGTGDGFGIEYTASSAASYLQPGRSLTFSFTTADTTASVNGNSVFYPGIPVNTSFVYPEGAFSDAGHEFVVMPTPASTPPPNPTIVGERVVPISLKHNKQGKPIGTPVLSFVFQFSTAMNQSSVSNSNNYQLDWVSTKKVKKKVQSVLHPVAIKSATYNASTNSITLATSATSKTFAKGGQLTLIGSPPGGVESAAGAFLSGTTVFMISPKGSRLVP